MLSVNSKADNLLALSIQLITNDQLEFLFQVSMKAEIDQLIARFRELKSGTRY
jgi:hypothetical protein